MPIHIYLPVGVHIPRGGMVESSEDVSIPFQYIQFSRMVVPVCIPTKKVLAFSLYSRVQSTHECSVHSLFISSHSDGCVVLSHCGFNLSFLDG